MSEKIDILFKPTRVGTKIPQYATSGSAAADLHALIEQDVQIEPGESDIIPTGVSIELPNAGYVALVFARSGLAIKSGIALSNGVGVIDSDYRGEICVGLINNSKTAFTVKNGDRIAQLCIMPVICANFVESAQLSDTKRGVGGFGSTGV